MIQLNEGICYSPHPNIDYRYPHIIEGGGLAAFFGDDLQMWNLAWLTDPNWDYCLDVQGAEQALSALRKLDPVLVGLVKRAFIADDDVNDFGSPSLRELLKWPPREFMREFTKKDLMSSLELVAAYGPPLISTMWSRARLSQPLTPDPAVAQFVERAMGNVIQFRRR